jgi:dsRNA-specific ribonuclease
LEKLELLGDAVFELLYLAIICRLFWKDGELISPGKITEGKIFILSNLNMAKMAANLNIHRYVQNCTSEIVESLN